MFIINHNLLVFFCILGIFLLDFFLQAEDYGAGGIYDFDVVAAGRFIGIGRLAMGAEQHLGVVQAVEFVMVDGDESHSFEALHFPAVVHNVAQTVQYAAFGQLLFGFADGVDHSEAEARSVVYFYFCHIYNGILRVGKHCFPG